MLGRKEMRHGCPGAPSTLYVSGVIYGWLAFAQGRGERELWLYLNLSSTRSSRTHTHTYMQSLQPELHRERFGEHMPTTSPWLIFPKSSMGAVTSHCHISLCSAMIEKSKDHTNIFSYYITGNCYIFRCLRNLQRFQGTLTFEKETSPPSYHCIENRSWHLQ